MACRQIQPSQQRGSSQVWQVPQRLNSSVSTRRGRCKATPPITGGGITPTPVPGLDDLTIEDGLEFTFEGVQEYVRSLDWSAMLSQAQSGLETTVQQAISPFDVFSGQWGLNLLLVGVVGTMVVALATAPRQ